jgi:hypothetical protein
MDFIVGLPHTSRGYNSIWVLTKSAHFIPVSITYRVGQYGELYMSHIVRYHGILKTIISNRGSIFVACFWEELHDCLGTHLIYNSAYHPQIDMQTEWVNQIIKDMSHACVLNDGLKWDKHLPLAQFSYNNSYQQSIKMSSFKALYGWHYRTPLSWSESDERLIFGPDIVTEVEEKVKQICASILSAHLVRRVTPTRGIAPWNLKWVITYTIKLPQWKVRVTLASKES